MSETLQVEKKRLWELVQEGKSADEIMNTLNIKNMAALKQALQELFRETGETVNVPGLIGQASVRAKYTDKGIRINPEMLGGADFHIGDEFDLRIEENRITLDRKK